MDLIAAVVQPDAFGGTLVVQNTIRLVTIFVGFTLAAICLKFTWLSWRHHEAFRAWGLLSYGCFVAAPSVMALFRFDEPIVWPSTVVYLVGLVCGGMALHRAITVSPEWIRIRRADRRRRRARHRMRRRV